MSIAAAVVLRPGDESAPRHKSTARVAALYGCAPDIVRRWLLAAGERVPGRGRWPRPPGPRPNVSADADVDTD